LKSFQRLVGAIEKSGLFGVLELKNALALIVADGVVVEVLGSCE